MRVSAVVCTHADARFPLLRRAVASLRSQTLPPDEIVVVVDANPGLFARVAEQCPGITVIAHGGAAGLSGARNAGTAAASGDVVAYLDDDAAAEPGWLAALVRHYADPAVLGVGGRAEPVWEGARPAWWPDEFDWVVGCGYRGQPSRIAPVRNLMGCNMTLRRSAAREAGGFDTALGRTGAGAAGCEETELCIRMAAARPGGVFLLDPAARVRHHVPRERATAAYFRRRCLAEGASKARMMRRTGAAGLSSERAYLRRTLPAGVARNLAHGVRGEVAGILRAGAIVAGAGLTACGFAGGRVRGRRAPAPAAAPILPLILEDRQDAAAAARPGGPGYGRALCLVLRDGVPVGRRMAVLDDVPLGEALIDDALNDEALIDDALNDHALIDDAPPGAAPPAPDRPDGRRPPGPAAPRRRGEATVVIATHDRPAGLAECVASVWRGTAVPARIVVVDNAPSDDAAERTVAALGAGPCPVLYVREDRPGLALAHNAALPHIDTPVTAFTDDDVLVHERWLEALLGVFDADPSTMCVTGMIAPRELDTLPQQWVETRAVFDKGLRRTVFDLAAPRPGDPLFPLTAGAFGSGANMAFRTGRLRAAGGFDPALGAGTAAMGGDDLAAFYDVVRGGHRLTYEPSAIVLHPHHRDYAQLRRQAYGYGVGLGAYLTRCVLDDPRTLAVLARNAPAAVARVSGGAGEPVIPGLPPYPRALVRAQRRGMAAGPYRYLRSRRLVARAAGEVRA